MPFTGTGDNGRSSAANFKNESKYHPIFEFLGSLDELNARIGLAHSMLPEESSSEWIHIKQMLFNLQNELFDIGGSIHIQQLTIHLETRIARMEKYIHETDAQLDPLKNFILAGGDPIASQLHLCRTATRYSERMFMHFFSSLDAANQPSFLNQIEVYLNRLSSVFFTLARQVNKLQGKRDVIWTANRDLNENN